MFLNPFKPSPRKIADEAIKDPSRVYDHPEDVLSDKRLSAVEKDRILESWKLDQEALLRGEDEYMVQNGGRKSPAAIIQEIHKAQEMLKFCH